MNELLKYILLNIGKSVGIAAGFVFALFIIFLGIKNTLFIALLCTLGYFLGKWYDQGVSYKKVIRDLLSTLKAGKWQ